MRHLTYTQRKDIPDRNNLTHIKWDSTTGYTGTFEGKVLFQVITVCNVDRKVIERLLNQWSDKKGWIKAGKFQESTCFDIIFYNGEREYAKKYYGYHSLHRCQELAESIVEGIIQKLMVGA